MLSRPAGRIHCAVPPHQSPENAQRQICRLAQDEEPGAPGGEAGGRRRLEPVSSLLLKRASASRPSGQWNDDDFDVLANGVVVGRIFKANASPVGASWM
jgi:hypothetical protein